MKKVIIIISLILFPTLAFAITFNRSYINTTNPYLLKDSSLVGWWTFDGKDMTNGRVNDISGNANHGNLINIATSTFYRPGKIGQGFNFDGTDDYVNVGNNSSLSPTTGITISAWVRPLKKSNAANYSAITAKGGSLYALMIRQDGIVTFYLQGVANWLTNDGTKDLFDGSWHYVTATYDGNFQRIYVDALLMNSNAITGTITSSSVTTVIGRDTTGASTYVFNGSLDDVRIYNRALSAKEITQLYNMGTNYIKTKYNKTKINTP